MYRIGEGVTRDPKQAAKWYAMGAAKGNPLAQVGLGFMVYNPAATTLLRLAASQGKTTVPGTRMNPVLSYTSFS